jgi:GT2 family glycosyltransferase
MPTYNRRDRLVRVLGSLAAQSTDEEFEVLVVSDGSSDGTNEYLSSEEVPLPVRAVIQENQGPAAARNAGLHLAQGELVLFLDDDVVAGPELIATHLAAHRRLGDQAVVVGPMLDPADHRMQPWVAWEQAMLSKQYRALTAGEYRPTSRQFYTGNASVRRSHLLDVGGFDASFRRAEDIELAFRLADAGLSFEFEPQAIGYHYAERSFENWRTNAVAYGRNDIVFARDLGRRWIYGEIHNSYRSRHFALRWLTMVSVLIGPFGDGVSKLLGYVVQHPSRRSGSRVTRYLLSALYGVEYHRGVAEELGSFRTFRRLTVLGALPNP